MPMMMIQRRGTVAVPLLANFSGMTTMTSCCGTRSAEERRRRWLHQLEQQQILSRRSSFIHYIFAHPSTHNQRRSPIHHLASQRCLPFSFVSCSPRQHSSSPCHAVLVQRRRSGLAGYCLIGAHDGTSSSSRNGRRMSARSHSRQRRRQLFGKRRTTMMMISPFHRRHLVQEAPEPPLRPRASV